MQLYERILFFYWVSFVRIMGIQFYTFNCMKEYFNKFFLHAVCIAVVLMHVLVTDRYTQHSQCGIQFPFSHCWSGGDCALLLPELFQAEVQQSSLVYFLVCRSSSPVS